MFLEYFKKAAERAQWRFREKGGSDRITEPLTVESKETACGKFSVTKTVYRVEKDRISRIFVTDGDQLSVLVEGMIFNQPTCAYTSFSLPLAEDLSCNVAGKNRLVFRSKGFGAKLFRVFHSVDGEDAMENGGLLLPDGFQSGLMNFSAYSGIKTFGCRHVSAYAMTEDGSDRIPGWHMEGKGTVEITAPDKSCRLRLVLDEMSVTLDDPVLGTVQTILL